MQAPPDRVEEAATLSALLALDILDTEPEIEFDALVRAASTHGAFESSMMCTFSGAGGSGESIAPA